MVIDCKQQKPILDGLEYGRLSNISENQKENWRTGSENRNQGRLM